MPAECLLSIFRAVIQMADLDVSGTFRSAGNACASIHPSLCEITGLELLGHSASVSASEKAGFI